MRRLLSGSTDLAVSSPVTVASADTRLDAALCLNPQVALRPEPFGALAYNYGNRRLVFLKHPDVVRVAKALDSNPSLRAALEACAIAPTRWPSFVTAFESLKSSEVVHER